MSSPEAHSRRPVPRAWAALAGALVVAAHSPAFFHRLLDGDEAIYGTIAALMNLGAPLYAEGGVDNKPPGIFWVYSIAFRIFGTYQMTAVHAVALLTVLITCVLIYAIGARLSGPRAGLIAAILYGLLTASGNPRLLAANTELFMMLPLSASVLLTLRRQWLWAAALLVAAGAFRQVAAINVLLIPVALIYLQPRHARAQAALWSAAGLGAGVVVLLSLVGLTASLPGFWRWTVGSLYGYATTSWTPGLVWMRLSDSLAPFAVSLIGVWVAAIAWLVRWPKLSPEHRVVAAWLPIAFAGSIAGGHISWHYFIQTMGPMALLAAFAVDHALHTRWKRQIAVIGIAAIAIPSLAWGAFDVGADPLTYDFGPRPPQHAAVAAYIRTHSSPGDRVFVWGDWPALYVESDRLMASRFPGFLRGFARGSGLPPANWDTTPDVWPALQADLERNPPALIVDTAAPGWSDFESYPMADYPVLASLVAGRYHRVAVVDGVVIYARNT